MTRITIVCTSFIIVSLVFAGLSYAKVDPETIVGIWLFDEGGGDVAQDSSGNGNDGMLNGPEWTNEGKFGGALEFNGAGSYIEFATGQSMKTPRFTIMAWFNTRKLDGYGHIFQTGNDWNDMAGYVFRVHQEGTVQGGLAFGPGNITTFVTGPAIEADTWYHLALTYDGTTATLYLDSENVSSNPGQGEIMYDDQPVRIGVHSGDTGAAFDGFIDEVGLFDVALEAGDIEAIMNGGIAGVAGAQPFASRPIPQDGALHADTWVTLSWQPGDFADSHDVYLGDNFENVNNATRDSDLYRGNQALTFYVAGFPGYAYPEGLVPGTTYHWRIDEVNAPPDETVYKGEVWSFSIPPKTAYNPNPADGADSVDADARLSWTPGFGAKLHTVYLGDDFETVANATVGVPSGTTSYKPGSLEREKIYYWRIDEFDGLWTYKGDIWAFATLGAVGNPQPANGATDVGMATILSWTTADNAASHQVYLGLDKDAVRSADTTSPEYKGSKTLGNESYDAGLLDLGTTYYWRVDAVYDGNPVKGPVWSFTVGDYLLVEDFESYTDDDAAGEAIWQTWIDGFGIADNGAQVGYLMPPYAEQTIVHGGSQSMPLLYANETGVTNSEGMMTLTTPRDWAQAGISDLSLWFRGTSGNTAEPLYVAISNSASSPAVVAHDDSDAATGGTWREWCISLSAFADQGINLSNVDKIAIGLGSKSGVASAGGSGTMYFDDIRLYTSRTNP